MRKYVIHPPHAYSLIATATIFSPYVHFSTRNLSLHFRHEQTRLSIFSGPRNASLDLSVISLAKRKLVVSCQWRGTSLYWGGLKCKRKARGASLTLMRILSVCCVCFVVAVVLPFHPILTHTGRPSIVRSSRWTFSKSTRRYGRVGGADIEQGIGLID